VPFVFVVEDAIPNEKINGEELRTSMGTSSLSPHTVERRPP
jgi:hypothetical protein